MDVAGLYQLVWPIGLLLSWTFVSSMIWVSRLLPSFNLERVSETRSNLKIRGLTAFVVCAAFMLAACDKPKQTALPTPEVVVTNIFITNQTVFNPTGSVSTVILLTNGIYFGSRADNRSISVDIPEHYTAWIYYNATNTKPRRMIHQFYGTNRYWLTDLDADGVPDTRVDYNDGPKRSSKSIFVKGDWIDADLRNTNATASLDGVQKTFTFHNGKWRSHE